MAASKLLNLRSSALHNLIRRHILHPSATSKILLPFNSNRSLNLFPQKSGGVSSHNNSSLRQWPLGSSLMQFEAARTYATKGDRDDADPDGAEGSDDAIDFDDDIENYSGPEFDEEDEYEDPDEDPDTK